MFEFTILCKELKKNLCSWEDVQLLEVVLLAPDWESALERVTDLVPRLKGGSEMYFWPKAIKEVKE